MDCSCGDGWIVACVNALGVIFMGGTRGQKKGKRIKLSIVGVQGVLGWTGCAIGMYDVEMRSVG